MYSVEKNPECFKGKGSIIHCDCQQLPPAAAFWGDIGHWCDVNTRPGEARPSEEKSRVTSDKTQMPKDPLSSPCTAQQRERAQGGCSSTAPETACWTSQLFSHQHSPLLTNTCGLYSLLWILLLRLYCFNYFRVKKRSEQELATVHEGGRSPLRGLHHRCIIDWRRQQNVLCSVTTATAA